MDYKEKIIALLNDKELSQEQKEKLEEVFPELTGSEGEKVRKALVEMVHDTTGDELWIDYNVHKEEALAWLEKQESVNEIVSRCRTSWYNEGKIAGMAEGLTDDEKYQQGWHDALEKQGEQKPSDKIKPKFKVGDWVVNNGHSYLIADIDFLDNRYLFEIGGYTHEQLNWEYIENVDNKYHLWTILDAKDGDVLYCENSGIEYIVMNKGINKCNNIDSYFEYNSEDGFDIGVPSVLSAVEDIITPATKEQRDFLFKKMKEAGYEWDAEKRELKLLITNGGDFFETENYEQKPANTVEQKCEESKTKIFDAPTPFEDKLYVFVAACEFLAIPSKIEFILEHSQEILDAAREQIGKERKPTWSEEDEKMLQGIWDEILANKHNAKECEWKTYDKFLDWLKSLKPQNRWKPSDEQMEALEDAIRYGEEENIGILSLLYNDLKKLKG